MTEQLPPLARITVAGTIVEVPAIETWTGNEWLVLEREVGITPVDVPDAIRKGALSFILGCLWVARHRDDPMLKVADLGDFPIAEIRVQWAPETTPPEAAPEEPAPADAADDGAPLSTSTEPTLESTGNRSSDASTG